MSCLCSGRNRQYFFSYTYRRQLAWIKCNPERQERWDNSTQGHWTYRIFPKVLKWIKRRHEEAIFDQT